jgi:Tfp pilus assembly protein FimT
MELIVVVAMVGIVALVTVPALLQVMPQYRIRSAASETAAAIRMIRQRAVTTRSPWRISFDTDLNRYRYYALNSPFADMSVAGNWTLMSRDARNPPDGDDDEWVQVTAVQLDAATNSFKDVVCPTDGKIDLIFTRDGSVSNKAACGAAATDVLTFTPAPSVLFSVDSSFVRFNRYTISVTANGTVSIAGSKV